MAGTIVEEIIKSWLSDAPEALDALSDVPALSKPVRERAV